MSDAQKKTVVVDEQIVNNDQTANPSPPAPEPPKPFDLELLALTAGVRAIGWCEECYRHGFGAEATPTGVVFRSPKPVIPRQLWLD